MFGAKPQILRWVPEAATIIATAQHIKLGLLCQGLRYIWLLWLARPQGHDLLSSGHLAWKALPCPVSLALSACGSGCVGERASQPGPTPLSFPSCPPPEFHHCLVYFWFRGTREVSVFGK